MHTDSRLYFGVREGGQVGGGGGAGRGVTHQGGRGGGQAIMAPLWIMRRESDPYLKVNVSRCPCHSPSRLHPLLHYSRWPWPQNNIHLNKPLRLLGTPANLISSEEKATKSCAHSWWFHFPAQSVFCAFVCFLVFVGVFLLVKFN